MKKYTFEQIVNERIREFDELTKETEKFSELVSYGELFESTRNIYHFDIDKLVMYYRYLNLFLRDTESFIFISNIDEVQPEYRKCNNDVIFTINDVKEFKERLQTLKNSPLFNELHSSHKNFNPIIYSTDGKTQLQCSGACAYFKHDNKKINFWNQGDVMLEGNSLNAREILDIFKDCTFDSDCFSEYFSKRVENVNNTDLSIEISDTYEPFQYGEDADNNYDFFNIYKNKTAKKLFLMKKIK